MKFAIHKVAFNDVSFAFDEHAILQNASLVFPETQPVRVFGAMGGGKSVLLKLLAGLLMPKAGHVLINDQPIDDLSFEEFLPLRIKIGYGFDGGGLLNNRSLFENLSLPLEYHKLFSRNDIISRVAETLDRFDLSKVCNKRPAAVSASQRKAAVVARALVHDPEMLILDDPTLGLDASSKDELFKWIGEHLNSGTLRYVIISSPEKFSIPGWSIEDLELNESKLKWRKALERAA